MRRLRRGQVNAKWADVLEKLAPFLAKAAMAGS